MSKILEIEDYFEQQKSPEAIIASLKQLDLDYLADPDSPEAFANICNYLTLCAMEDIKIDTAVFNMQGKAISKEDLAKMNAGNFNEVAEGCLFISLRSEEDGRNYLPVFTSPSEYRELSGTYPIQASLSLLISYVYCVEGVDGLIIDPYSDAVIIDKDNVELMIELLQNQAS